MRELTQMLKHLIFMVLFTLCYNYCLNQVFLIELFIFKNAAHEWKWPSEFLSKST
jgi:hypothetical protein